ncbi:MAG: GNAT family N-acetyltransferase [Oscillospiraceae bacterium]|jgi:L-amino acid N-acyltransferase YncA|nr:GNAT family N-acetyltransferase [Oscillospiraceae bacterium]
MNIEVRQYTNEDLPEMRIIWNEIVREGNAYPQEEYLDEEDARHFFAEQSYTGVAVDSGNVVGLYILHPNNVGRCGHIANASYAVKSGQRGKRIGESLVVDSMRVASLLSFRLLQFNAVVASNERAIRLYKKLGFTRLGTIEGGFRMDNGQYVDIIPFYKKLI